MSTPSVQKSSKSASQETEQLSSFQSKRNDVPVLQTQAKNPDLANTFAQPLFEALEKIEKPSDSESFRKETTKISSPPPSSSPSTSTSLVGDIVSISPIPTCSVNLPETKKRSISKIENIDQSLEQQKKPKSNDPVTAMQFLPVQSFPQVNSIPIPNNYCPLIINSKSNNAPLLNFTNTNFLVFLQGFVPPVQNSFDNLQKNVNFTGSTQWTASRNVNGGKVALKNLCPTSSSEENRRKSSMTSSKSAITSERKRLDNLERSWYRKNRWEHFPNSSHLPVLRESFAKFTRDTMLFNDVVLLEKRFPYFCPKCDANYHKQGERATHKREERTTWPEVTNEQKETSNLSIPISTTNGSTNTCTISLSDNVTSSVDINVISSQVAQYNNILDAEKEQSRQGGDCTNTLVHNPIIDDGIGFNHFEANRTMVNGKVECCSCRRDVFKYRLCYSCPSKILRRTKQFEDMLTKTANSLSRSYNNKFPITNHYSNSNAQQNNSIIYSQQDLCTLQTISTHTFTEPTFNAQPIVPVIASQPCSTILSQVSTDSSQFFHPNQNVSIPSQIFSLSQAPNLTITQSIPNDGIIPINIGPQIPVTISNSDLVPTTMMEQTKASMQLVNPLHTKIVSHPTQDNINWINFSTICNDNHVLNNSNISKPPKENSSSFYPQQLSLQPIEGSSTDDSTISIASNDTKSKIHEYSTKSDACISSTFHSLQFDDSLRKTLPYTSLSPTSNFNYDSSFLEFTRQLSTSQAPINLQNQFEFTNKDIVVPQNEDFVSMDGVAVQPQLQTIERMSITVDTGCHSDLYPTSQVLSPNKLDDSVNEVLDCIPPIEKSLVHPDLDKVHSIFFPNNSQGLFKDNEVPLACEQIRLSTFVQQKLSNTSIGEDIDPKKSIE